MLGHYFSQPKPATCKQTELYRHRELRPATPVYLGYLGHLVGYFLLCWLHGVKILMRSIRFPLMLFMINEVTNLWSGWQDRGWDTILEAEFCGSHLSPLIFTDCPFPILQTEPKSITCFAWIMLFQVYEPFVEASQS